MCDTIQNNVRVINDKMGILSGSSIDSSRTDDNCLDSFQSRQDKNNDSTNNQLIYRFKFDNEFLILLYNFAKLHQYDTRQDFKEAWKEWTENHMDEISQEEGRLIKLGYDGNAKDKMFKSARYYLRKKSTVKKQPKNRKKYIGISKKIINLMDVQISNGLGKGEMKPSEGYNTLISYYKDEIGNESKELLENNYTKEEINNKLKKTYKNRYFIYTNKTKNGNYDST